MFISDGEIYFQASGGKVNQCSGGYCGPYKISEPYYKDCGKPGAGKSPIHPIYSNTKTAMAP